MRSSLFLASYTGIVQSVTCALRSARGRNGKGEEAVLAAALTGFALFFEHPKRHAELTLYVLPRAAEAALNLLDSVELLPSWLQVLRHTGTGDVLMFMAAISLAVFNADTEPRMKGVNASVFRLLFGSGTTMLAKKKEPPTEKLGAEYGSEGEDLSGEDEEEIGDDDDDDDDDDASSLVFDEEIDDDDEDDDFDGVEEAAGLAPSKKGGVIRVMSLQDLATLRREHGPAMGPLREVEKNEKEKEGKGKERKKERRRGNSSTLSDVYHLTPKKAYQEAQGQATTRRTV